MIAFFKILFTGRRLVELVAVRGRKNRGLMNI